MTTFGPDNDPVIPVPDPVVSPTAADNVLIERVEALRKVIAKLTPEVTALQTEQKTVWNWLKSGAGLIGFDVIVTILGIIYGFYLHHVEADNHDLLNQVQAQQVRLNTSIHETCNLYGTFIGFYSDAARARFVGGPSQYDQLYITLQNSADHLQCGIKHVVPGT